VTKWENRERHGADTLTNLLLVLSDNIGYTNLYEGIHGETLEGTPLSAKQRTQMIVEGSMQAIGTVVAVVTGVSSLGLGQLVEDAAATAQGVIKGVGQRFAPVSAATEPLQAAIHGTIAELEAEWGAQ